MRSGDGIGTYDVVNKEYRKFSACSQETLERYHEYAVWPHGVHQIAAFDQAEQYGCLGRSLSSFSTLLFLRRPVGLDRANRRAGPMRTRQCRVWRDPSIHPSIRHWRQPSQA